VIGIKHLMAVIGFAFVAMWIATNLGYAVLCLVGAVVFYLGAGVLQGEIDLARLQDQLGARQGSGDGIGPRPPRAPRARVQ
jgi:hypothetical protein